MVDDADDVHDSDEPEENKDANQRKDSGLPDEFWHVLGEPASPAEAAALHQFRRMLPNDGVTTAWVNLTFIDDGGRTGEIDVLLLTRSGFYLVELKGWGGYIQGDQVRWQLRRGNVENPLLLTDRKSKRLASLLKRGRFKVSPEARRSLPFVRPLVVMHGEGSTLDLSNNGETNVVTLNGYKVKIKGEPVQRLTQFLAAAAEHPRDRIDARRAHQIRTVCRAAGFKPTPKSREVADYVVDPDIDPVAEGPDWQDVVVKHPDVDGVLKRIRLYDITPRAPKDERARLERLAKREYQLTFGINHDGITAPTEFRTTPDGPALLFDHDPREMRLDVFLSSEQGRRLVQPARVALVRQLGEVLRYAHQRRIQHRALSPAHVWVTPQGDDRPARVAVRNWFAGSKERSETTTRLSVLSGHPSDIAGSQDARDLVYLAPESIDAAGDVPGIAADVFGLGALAYLILTGRAPGADRAEVDAALEQRGGLDPRRASSDVPDDVADVVLAATARWDVDRLSTVEDVLELLSRRWLTVRTEEPDAPRREVIDPLDADEDADLDDRFLVMSRRGEGSSGLALGVKDIEADDPDRELILKVARNQAATERLAAEVRALAQLDHRRVVRLVEPELLEVGGRAAILMTDAGTETLATRLAKEGRATVEQLERYGGQLLEAMVHVESTVGFHRDVKPANLGIIPDPGTRKPSLVLFDFSLSAEPVDNIEAGTPGYLDPYLGRGRRRRYDRAAELWAVATTLFEMATGSLPWWPQNMSRPSKATEAPVVERSSFEPSVSAAMARFFTTALHPAANQRHGSAAQMAEEWHRIFAALDTGAADAEANDELAARVTADTPLSEAGLSARALSGARRLDGVVTVSDLLGTSPVTVNAIPGLGERYRKELARRISQWREALTSPAEAPSRGTEQRVERLLARIDRPDDQATIRAVLEGLDGNDWPELADVATHLGRTRPQVSAAVQAAVERWSGHGQSVLDETRSTVVRLLAEAGRVMTRRELARALAANLGSLRSGPERLRAGTALLRAVVELDARHPDPRLELRRRRHPAKDDLLALHKSADPLGQDVEHPDADVLTELAAELGDTADALVADGIVAFSRAAPELEGTARSVTGAAPQIGSRRLLRLAAAASTRAHVSVSFDELYPADLEPATALEVSMRGRPARPIAREALRANVVARFGGVEFPPSGPALDALVHEVLGMTAQRNGDDTVYEPQQRGTTTAFGSTTRHGSAPVSPTHEAERELARTLPRHSALTLCTRPRYYARAVADLSRAYGVEVLDVPRLLVDATRETAARHGIDWGFLLGVDAGPAGGADRQRMATLVRQAVEPVWREQMARDVPLLVTHASPLVRYGLGPLLAEMLDLATPRPAARWLLVARDGRSDRPLLDGEPVPVGVAGWVDLPAHLSAFGSETARPDTVRPEGDAR
ncbi:BREX system serine/threonine kinase PglW [Isoptericola croceus]|uniref:BREX system serine/threonine kinase PglW n=1 Tax=Isoptericola croceus TaxID=3031406 RepID=UPI0023F93097|nr:BREX system serine/threonine kinase PglW [Isoptericola croceus]